MDLFRTLVALVMLGIVLFAAFATTHSGLGASGAISRLEAAAEATVAQAHVDRVGYLAAMAGGNGRPHPSSGWSGCSRKASSRSACSGMG